MRWKNKTEFGSNTAVESIINSSSLKAYEISDWVLGRLTEYGLQNFFKFGSRSKLRYIDTLESDLDICVEYSRHNVTTARKFGFEVTEDLRYKDNYTVAIGRSTMYYKGNEIKVELVFKNEYKDFITFWNNITVADFKANYHKKNSTREKIIDNINKGMELQRLR